MTYGWAQRLTQESFSTGNSRKTQHGVTEGWKKISVDQVASFWRLGKARCPVTQSLCTRHKRKAILLPESSDRQLVNKCRVYWSGLALHPGSAANCVIYASIFHSKIRLIITFTSSGDGEDCQPMHVRCQCLRCSNLSTNDGYEDDNQDNSINQSIESDPSPGYFKSQACFPFALLLLFSGCYLGQA